VIRASAVSALASFAHSVPSLRKSIVILLQKCLTDSDDEVRERAFFFVNLLATKQDTDLSEDPLYEFSAAPNEEGAALSAFVFD